MSKPTFYNATSCGYCGKVLNEETKHNKKCVLCTNVVNIHAPCAAKLVTSHFKKLNNRLSKFQQIEQRKLHNNYPHFNKSKIIHLFCKNCESSCFFCGINKYHVMSDRMAMTQEKCTDCKERWCFLLERVPPHKQKKIGLTHTPCQKRGTKDPILCYDCQSKEAQKPAALPTIQRYKTHRDVNINCDSFKFNTTNIEITSNITDSIDKYFGITQGRFVRKFPTFGLARDNFERKLGFITDTSTNIFDFKLPLYIAENHSEEDRNKYKSCFSSNGTGGLHISMDDINRLLDNKGFLNDAIINFVLSCFNHFSFSKLETRDEIPPTVFGLTTDVLSIVPDKNNGYKTNIMHEFHEVRIDGAAELKQEYTREAVTWYSQVHKRYVSKLIDYSIHKNRKIRKFATVIGNNQHWSTLCVDMMKPTEEGNKNSFFPHQNSYNRNDSAVPNLVYTIDNMGGNDSFHKCARLYYAKFFALYSKEFDGKEEHITEKDFLWRGHPYYFINV